MTGPCVEVRNLEDIPKIVTSSVVDDPIKVAQTELNLLEKIEKNSSEQYSFNRWARPNFNNQTLIYSDKMITKNMFYTVCLSNITELEIEHKAIFCTC